MKFNIRDPRHISIATFIINSIVALITVGFLFKQCSDTSKLETRAAAQEKHSIEQDRKNEELLNNLKSPRLALNSIGIHELNSKVHWSAMVYTILNTTTDRPVHVYYLKAGVRFNKLNEAQVRDTLSKMEFEQYNTIIPLGRYFDKTVSISRNLDTSMITKLTNGNSTLFLEIVYYNDVKKNWRDFLYMGTLARLKAGQFDTTFCNKNIDTVHEQLPLPENN